MPFKWVLLDWYPLGHAPPGVYDEPLFGIHFVMEPIESVLAVESGSCGPARVRCDQFEAGRRPEPANYVSRDFKDVNAVVPGRGNRLIDVSARGRDGERFTRSLIFGA